MKYLILIVGCIWVFSAQAVEGVKVADFKAAAIVNIKDEYPKVAPDNLVFYDIDVSVIDKDLKKSYLTLGFIDESSRHSTGSSPYAYDTYIVDFSFISGDLVQVKKGFWAGFEPAKSDEIK